jgi:hydroxymethylpyrimidine/phosphomethylpyrimidine kinase
MNLPPRVLTIAGSDSSGGAGIQADLKTMCALGCYGMSALTAVTSQNTMGVFGVQEMPPEFVSSQITRVLDDVGADAIKIGMLANAEVIQAVAETLAAYPQIPVVLDPVMIAKSGDGLLRADAQGALKSLLIPIAAVVTPNVPEAEAITGLSIGPEEEPITAAAHALLRMGAHAVLIKGGHLPGELCRDYFFDETGEIDVFEGPRVDTRNTHGTGCTLASAIACHLARALPLRDAIAESKAYLQGAIENALPLGNGHGPLRHGWRQE